MKKALFLTAVFALLFCFAMSQQIPYAADSKEYNDYKLGLIEKGWIPASAGTTEKDAGTTEKDAGTTEKDAGTTEKDAGTTEKDAGTTEHKTGKTESDTGSTYKGMVPLAFNRQTRTGLLIPYDAGFQLALSSNDDSYTSAIAMPFAFDFYGSTQTEFYINNNGNISFGNPFSTYTSSGFPIAEFPMLAAFWADVDTRPAASGQVYYKVEPTRVTVIWDGVGYYSNHTDKLNTFEVIFTNGLDPLIGIGNNVAFSYGDMQWTTGDASGGSDGFGGTPATVGLNKGDGINYGLIGRFDHDGSDYNGPGGTASGISYLDNQLFTFSTMQGNNIPPIFTGVPSSAVLLQVGDSTTINITSVSPLPTNLVDAVVQHDFTSGFSVSVVPGNPCSITIEINALSTNLGLHPISIIASDNGNPVLSSTASFNVNIYSLSEYLLAANILSKDISVIDMASGTVYGPFLTGQLGTGSLLDIVVSPDNQFALVSNFEDNTVYHINVSDPLNPSVIASYYLGFPAEDIALSQDGRFALVADGGNQTSLAVLDLQSRTTVQIENISPRYAQGVSLGPDGKVLVNDCSNGFVYQYLLNLQTGQLSPTTASEAVPYTFNTAIHPSGNYAIACSGTDNSTKVLKLNQDNTITTLQTLNVTGSQCARYSSDGTKAFLGVTGSSPDALYEYNVQPDGSLVFGNSFNLPTDAAGGYYGVDPVAISANNGSAYIANMCDSYPYLTAIDLITGMQTQIQTGSPVGLAIANTGLKAQFSYSITNIGFGSQVQFNQHSIGAPTAFLWNFGDGESSTLANPLHTYLLPGVYSVSLTVFRGAISNTSTQILNIFFDPNIHLTLAGSPYYFANTITVLPSQSLTIDSGVVLNFAPDTGLVVNGTINVSGATFSGNETQGWLGITINTSQSPLVFNNCTVWHAIQALKITNTSFTINNLLINKTNIFPDEVGIWVLGASNIIFNNVQVLNYTRGIVFNNEDLRITSSPTLTNVRIRNTSSTIRPVSRGLEVIGAVGLAITGAEIEEFDEGVYWDGQGTSDYRTTPTLTNVRIRNTSSTLRSASFGLKLLNLSSVIADNDSIGGYPIGLELENLDTNRTITSATLTNVRIRNTSSTLRTDTFGAKLTGNIAATVNNLEITDYSTGMLYQGTGEAQRASATLTNVRIRNTSSTLRSADNGIKLIDLGSVVVENDTIEGYANGFSLETTEQTRTTTSATLTNVRIRNTSSTLRTETTAASLKGSVNASIDSLEIEDYSTGIYYEGDGQPFERTTPTLTNVRIRNTSSTLREPVKGMVLKNLAAVNLQQNIIYPNLTAIRGNAEGNGIILDEVANASIMQNNIWGLTNGLKLINSGNVSFTENIVWTNGAELDNPVDPPNSGAIITNNVISYSNGIYPGAGNVDLDPLFVDPNQGNFYLKLRSPLKNTGIGALPFDFTALAANRTYSMHRGWNLMGVPYTTLPGQNTPVAIFADDINPFYVAPNYTSIVQMNSNAMPDSLGHVTFNYSGSYNIPSVVRPAVGYWVNNPSTQDVPVDVYGLMDDGSYNLELPGSPLPNNGWYLVSNPYDRPIRFSDSTLLPSGAMLPWGYIYRRDTNSYVMVDADPANDNDFNTTDIPPWSAFFVKANSPADLLFINYPADDRQAPAQDLVASSNFGSSQVPKPEWEFTLNAVTTGHADAVTLGISNASSEGYDPMDVPELPSAPVVLNRGLDFCIANNDWEINPGTYTRDIRNKETNSWSWPLLLNLEALLENGRFAESIRISPEFADKLPATHSFMLQNPATGQSIDLKTQSLLLSVNIDTSNPAGGATPWLIPLTLMASPVDGGQPQDQRGIISTANYPNPFNPETTISYALGSDAAVSLEIYNLKGQLVNRLLNTNQTKGSHSVVWNGKDSQGHNVASGFYFYRLQAGETSQTRKILLMK